MGLDEAVAARRFLIRGEHANLWFEGQGDALVVSFDNLATIDEGWPRGPWAWKRLEPLGHSVLGVQSHAKDWFRQPTAPALLRGLEERGFFRRFRLVVLTGASMGGFAALNFAPLIPEARVLAFSPQTTMNRVIAPFEARFPYSVKRSNWEGMPFLDAAAAVPYIRRAVVVFDPMVPEDRAHAARLAGIGMHIDYYNRDRHAEYLVHSGDLHGFSHREIVVLAALVRWAGSGTPDLSAYSSVVQPDDARIAAVLATLLGLARGIRRRVPSPVLGLAARVTHGNLRIELSARDSLEAEAYELERHARRVEAALRLHVRRSSPAGRRRPS
jgi:hypothetical protein